MFKLIMFLFAMFVCACKSTKTNSKEERYKQGVTSTNTQVPKKLFEIKADSTKKTSGALSAPKPNTGERPKPKNN